MQQFALVIVDYRSQQSCTAMQSGQYEAANYDLSASGKATSMVDDTRALCVPACVNVQFDVTHSESKLDNMILVLRMMLGSDHPLVINVKVLMQRYTAYHLRIKRCMLVHCMNHYEACFIRYLSIELVDWFLNMDMSSVKIVHPNFFDLFNRMDVDDPSWFPTSVHHPYGNPIRRSSSVHSPISSCSSPNPDFPSFGNSGYDPSRPCRDCVSSN
jgi:hypothetical protein